MSLLTGVILFLDWKTSLGQLVFIYVFFTLFLAAIKLIKALLIHFFAESLGGQGRITRFLVLLSYADMPFHLLLPLGLLFSGSSALYLFPVLIVLSLWSGHLGLTALQAHYGLSWEKSFVAAATPTFFLVLPIFAAFAAVAGFFAGMAILFTQILS